MFISPHPRKILRAVPGLHSSYLVLTTPTAKELLTGPLPANHSAVDRSFANKLMEETRRKCEKEGTVLEVSIRFLGTAISAAVLKEEEA